MKTRIFFVLTLAFFAIMNRGHAFGSEPGIWDNMTLRGYVKGMQTLLVDRDYSETDFSSLLHNRLNYRWNISQTLTFRAEGRNRVFYNTMFRDFPFIKDIMEHDDGLVDLSWVWYSEGAWLGHTMIDRLHFDWQKSNWRVRVGRQRINWGITLVSNPNDLFNTYSFFDVDYPERPGTDAVRIQHYLGDLSRLELAYSPAENARHSVAAMLYGFNYRNYDIQTIAGYFRHRAALGLGWAGSIGGAGFKGEATWFYHLEEVPGQSRGDLVAAIGADYMFANGTFAVAEFLYNGGYRPFNGNSLLISQPLRPDNIMFSEFALTLSANHAISPVLDGGLAAMILPDIEAFFVSPNIKYSLMTDLDLEMVAQIFAGGRNSVFEQAGSLWFLSLKYSF
jgi:hypothetical protein